MALHSPTTHSPPGPLERPDHSILLLALDEELISLLRSRLSQTTTLSSVSITPDESSPHSSFSGKPFEARRIIASVSALSSSKYVSRLIRFANIKTILIDLRGHRNELGLSCAFLAALRKVGFRGHLIYISVSGDLLNSSDASRALRETYPVHAAVEVQLQNRGNRKIQNRFSWTTLGRSINSIDSISPSSSTSHGYSSPRTDGPHIVPREIDGERQGLSNSTLPGFSAEGLLPSLASEIAEGVIRAIRSQDRPSNGRKIMLDLANERRISFMHQTDWNPDQADFHGPFSGFQGARTLQRHHVRY